VKIALTGATGFIGRYIVAHLIDSGHSCRCWYRSQESLQRHAFATHDRVQWIRGELNDASANRELVSNCEAVIHAALYRSGDTFRGGEGPLEDFMTRNLLGTIQLIEAARSAGVPRFVTVSTCAVHERILDDHPLDETHPLWPTSHYGAHKAAIEKFVHSYGLGDNYDICAVRPTGVYGIADPIENSKWFELVRQIVQNENVVCRHGGKEVHALDVARACELLVRADNVRGEAFNCYDRYISDYDVATIAKRLCQSNSEIDGQATSPKYQIETGKIRQLGMKFGGTDLLQSTIQKMFDALGGSASRS